MCDWLVIESESHCLGWDSEKWALRDSNDPILSRPDLGYLYGYPQTSNSKLPFIISKTHTEMF